MSSWADLSWAGYQPVLYYSTLHLNCLEDFFTRLFFGWHYSFNDFVAHAVRSMSHAIGLFFNNPFSIKPIGWLGPVKQNKALKAFPYQSDCLGFPRIVFVFTFDFFSTWYANGRLPWWMEFIVKWWCYFMLWFLQTACMQYRWWKRGEACWAVGRDSLDLTSGDSAPVFLSPWAEGACVSNCDGRVRGSEGGERPRSWHCTHKHHDSYIEKKHFPFLEIFIKCTLL